MTDMTAIIIITVIRSGHSIVTLYAQNKIDTESTVSTLAIFFLAQEVQGANVNASSEEASLLVLS